MNNKGFTLIELLVVVSIVALLSSIVTVSLNTARAKGRYSQIVTQMRQMKIAADNYFSDNGAYPADAGIGVMPAGLSSYISMWPTPPCSNLTYDWNNFTGGTNVNIDLRTISPGASTYFYCVYALSGTTCGTGTSDITALSSKQISC